MKMGHLFTQGTADSNEVWLDVTVTQRRPGDRPQRRHGPTTGDVDPWSHFVNAYVLDREGRRIDRRNAQDIFVAALQPPDPAGRRRRRALPPRPCRRDVDRRRSTVDVALRYRKFDTIYMKHVHGDDYVNDLPVLTLATDRVTFPVAVAAARPAPRWSTRRRRSREWQRWNDYGIGLLRKGGSRGRAAPGRGGLRAGGGARPRRTGRSTSPASTSPRGRLQDEAIAALRARRRASTRRRRPGRWPGSPGW